MTTAVAAPAATPAQAPAAAPQAPAVPQPNGGANPQPGGAQNANPGAAERQRIALHALPKDTVVEVVGEGGKVREMTAEQALKFYGRQESANRKYEEAAQARRQIEADKAELQQAIQEIAADIGDPRRFRSALARLGLDPAGYVKMLAQIDAEEAALSPEQRKLREYEEADRQRKAQAEQEQAQAYEAERKHYRNEYAKAFHGVMEAEGIPKDSPLRDFLMPTLSRAAAYVEQTQGRRIKVSECKAIMANALNHAQQLANGRMTPEQRRALITDDDWAWYQGERLKRKPVAAPQLPHHSHAQLRTEQGQFRNPGEVDASGRPVRRNVNGKIIVDSAFNLYGNR